MQNKLIFLYILLQNVKKKTVQLFQTSYSLVTSAVKFQNEANVIYITTQKKN